MVEGQKVGKDAEIALLQKFDEIVELNPDANEANIRISCRSSRKSGIEKYDYQNNKYNIKIFNWFHGDVAQFSILCDIYDHLLSTFNINKIKIKNSDINSILFIG